MKPYQSYVTSKENDKDKSQQDQQQCCLEKLSITKCIKNNLWDLTGIDLFLVGKRENQRVPEGTKENQRERENSSIKRNFHLKIPKFLIKAYICRGRGINHYPQILLGPILYEMICGMDLKTGKIW